MRQQVSTQTFIDRASDTALLYSGSGTKFLPAKVFVNPIPAGIVATRSRHGLSFDCLFAGVCDVPGGPDAAAAASQVDNS